MSTTTREKFEKEFSNVWFIPESKERYIAFIETIEKEAEERWEIRMKKRVREIIDEWDDYVIFEEHFNQL
jgi:hypothetical protein